MVTGVVEGRDSLGCGHKVVRARLNALDQFSAQTSQEAFIINRSTLSDPIQMPFGAVLSRYEQFLGYS